jgi:AcrR family transcriptional regulator
MARRDTRELILATSLALFNEQGEPNVTTNQIADQAEISPGNLYYHFRHKQDIVQALFYRLAESLVPLTEISEEDEVDAESLWFRLHMIFEVKGQFRFVYRNIPDISARMPDVGKALKALLVREKRAIAGLLHRLADEGSMRADEQQLSMLIDQIMLTLTYWVPYADDFDPVGASDGSAQVRAIARVFLLTIPYLQEPWKSEANRLAEAYLERI